MSSKSPAEIAAGFANAYRCGHCRSRSGDRVEVAPGFFYLKIHHDDGCPVLTGVISSAPDVFRAASVA